MNKQEKAEILYKEASELLKASALVDEGRWLNGRHEVAAIAERLLQYFQETEHEYETVGGFRS